MSQLLPSHLSKTRKKPELERMLFACDYPLSIVEGEEKARNFPDIRKYSRGQDMPIGAIDGETSRKTRPVPVVMVNQDPLQDMEPDEYGTELGKEARVWKVYVKETDRWDAELVDGWNKSLDVILVFAALFSAVSTSFLIESSKKLQQDPSDVTAAALVNISQVLSVIASNSSMSLRASEPNPASGFEPTQHAVIVNTLWYLSLSLSIATSLLAMLAKDWCHSFSANRHGHPWDQVLQRQRKWEKIEQWKMQELITVLPSLIHLSLLLFAIGLCIYVRDINVTAAIPIVCVTGAAFAFYVWSSIMASFMGLFPYTTIISRALQSELARRQYCAIRGYWIKSLVAALTGVNFFLKWILIGLTLIPAILFGVICLPLLFAEILLQSCCLGWCGDTVWHEGISFLVEHVQRITGSKARSRNIDKAFARVRSSVESASPSPSDQDEVTSFALKWLIENCETPSSVTIALQAIAGASSKIPSAPLRDCDATLGILRRLVSSSPESLTGSNYERYIRALKFLESGAKEHRGTTSGMEKNKEPQESGKTGDIEVAIWDLKSEHEKQVVKLINTTEFRPTDDNIVALTLGNSATSLSLRLLKNQRQPASEAFGSIMTQLFKHVQDGRQNLAPLALHSLGHAAVMLNSCTDIPFLCSELTQRWLKNCLSLLGEEGQDRGGQIFSKTPQNNVSLQPETAVIICLLLGIRPAAEPVAASDLSHMIVAARVKRATKLLTAQNLTSPSYQEAFYRLGLLEVLFNEAEEVIEKQEAHQYREELSKNLKRSYPLLSFNDRFSSAPTTLDSGGSKISEFLQALLQLRELAESSVSGQPVTRCMPSPVYCTLIILAIRTQNKVEQAQCERLLSISAFPKLNDYLVLALQSAFNYNYLWPAEFRNWDRQDPAESRCCSIPKQRRNVEDPRLARLRHFAATQTWIFLCLVGDSSTHQQKRLKEIVGRYMYFDDHGERWTVKHAKRVLEDKIIESYREGHRLEAYSARVIECILEAREPSDEGGLAQTIQDELKDKNISPSIRGLKSFLPPVEQSQSEPQPTTADSVSTPTPSIQQTTTAELDPGLRDAPESSHPPLDTNLPPLSASSFLQASNTARLSSGFSPSTLHPDPETAHEGMNASHVAIPMSPNTSPTEET